VTVDFFVLRLVFVATESSFPYQKYRLRSWKIQEDLHAHLQAFSSGTAGRGIRQGAFLGHSARIFPYDSMPCLLPAVHSLEFVAVGFRGPFPSVLWWSSFLRCPSNL
jgi:hypothetical protein